jgi:hypothetical protein
MQQQLLQQAAEEVLLGWPECVLQSMQLLPSELAAAAAAAADGVTMQHQKHLMLHRQEQQQKQVVRVAAAQLGS